MDIAIKAKGAIVTGGSRGIGKSCVAELCSKGYKVAFIYEKDEENALKTENETGAYKIKCDVSDPVQVKNAVFKAKELLGSIDVLVNNAGISIIGLFTDMSNEDLQRIISVNLLGSAYFAREASKLMIANQYGRIINIGSMWGKTGASCEVAYSATKAGIRGLTMSLAKELGPSNITVNCIEPGVINTEMNKSIDKDTMNELVEETPLCRIGEPSDVAKAVAFLASDDASFITGQIIGVDGGFAI